MFQVITQTDALCRTYAAQPTQCVDVRHCASIYLCPSRSYAWYLTPTAFRECFPGQSSITASEYVACLLSTGISAHCPSCRTMNPISTTLTQAPPLIALETSATVPVRPESTIRLSVNNSYQTWRLAGAVYHGFDHFTARYVDSDGRTWYHDGDVTKHRCIPDVDILASSAAASIARSRTACSYIYALIH